MNELNVININGPADKSFIDDFVNLRKFARESKFLVGGPADAQVRGLIPWGLLHQSQFWLVKDKFGTPLARLCARVSPHISNHGTIGLFEIDLKSPFHKEAFQLITQTALDWLKQNHVREVAGPIDMSTWFTYRFSLPGKRFWPRFSWEPTTPDEYYDLFKSIGFKDLAFYHSVYFPHFRIGNFCIGTGPMKKSYQHLGKMGFYLRPFDQEKFMTHEVPVFHEISHEAFKDGFMFEPIDLTTFSSLYAGALKSYDFSPSSVLMSPKGEIGGFIFAFFDGNMLVIKSIALKKKFQGMNFSSGMIYNAAKQAFAKNKKGTVSALVKTGLASESIEKNVQKTLWLTWTHNYVLLNKEIS